MPSISTQRTRALALGVFMLAAIVSATMIFYSEQVNVQRARANAAGLAGESARGLESDMARGLSAAYALAALVRQGRGAIADFDAVASEMLRFYPNISALELSPGGVVRQAVPLVGNEKVIGFDQLRDPVQRMEALLARETGKLTLAGPLDLVQGGLGVVGRLPVFLNDADGKSYFWGFTNVVIRFPEALAGARLPLLADQGLDYELWRNNPDTGKKQVIAASSARPLVDPVSKNLELGSGIWTLSVSRVAGWRDSTELFLKSVLGLLVSLLLTYVTVLVMKQQAQRGKLEEKVAERTQALEKANNDLAGREALFRQILDTSSVAIFLVDMDGRITKANQRMAEMFGYSIEVLEGTEYVALVHPEERDLGRQKMQALLNSKIPLVDYDRLYWRSDQSEFWGHLTGKRFYSANGEELGLIGVIADVSARKNAEEQLQRQNNMLNAVIENFPGGISIVDADLRAVKYNDQFKRLLDLPDSLFDKPDLSFEDVIRFNAERGEYGPGDPEAKVSAMVARARDFQPHKFDRERADGTVLDIRGMPLPDGGFVSIYLDVTERKQMEDRVRQLAFYDPLTSLPNRRLLSDRLTQAMAASKRSECFAALMFLDLDNFKPLNDMHGHEVGDLLLIEAAVRMKRCVREMDTVARFGGDEFVVVLGDLTEDRVESVRQARGVAEKIRSVLAEPYQLVMEHDGEPDTVVWHNCTASIGVVLFLNNDAKQDDILKWADTAMYQAKEAGRNSIQFSEANGG